MRKYVFYILISVATIGMFSSAINVLGQTPLPSQQTLPPSTNTIPGGASQTFPTAGYQLLQPLPGVNSSFNPEQQNALGTYLNAMIKIFIGLCAVLAVVMIVVGGLQYMTTELISGKEAGRERITNALLGLLISLGAYVLLFTINPEILNTNVTLPSGEVTVEISSDVPQTADPKTGKYKNGYVVGTDWSSIAGATPSKPDWATVNRGECAKVGDDPCTSTKGLGLSYLIPIHTNCPSCALQINGGTETWLHGGATGSTSHGPGSSTVDLARNAALDAYIAGGQPLIYFHRYKNGKDGNTYLYEGSHWHVGP